MKPDVGMLFLILSTSLSIISFFFAGLNWSDFHKHFNTYHQKDFHLFEFFTCLGLGSFFANIVIIWFTV